MPKISVIIPVYNDEKYIAETLDSVINQTFTDWEAICVNDGSVDDSLKILKKYAKQDKRIKVINQKNQGVIVARTNGIKKSKSEYIYTLDGDDKIAPKTFEKMYQAITSGKADIITSRVMRFDMEGGEMVLPKPNKINMARRNCLVNAALMKKEDFFACGGFDEKFSSMLEDYDLWLNLIYNHNKKIYRIPKLLFFYRIKPRELSRNYQRRKTDLDNITKILYNKYPIRKWHRIGNILSYPRHFIRFFFRIQDGYIKIFKLPIFKLRKYDIYMSVGAACFVPSVLKQLNLRDFSGPFDWMYGSDVLTRLNIIKNEFKHYFDFQDFEYFGINQENGKAIYKNTRTGIVYNHDFPNDDFNIVFSDIEQKYNRRTKRVLRCLSKPNNILLVYAELGQNGNKEKIKKIIDDLNKKYVANIDFLYINNNKDIPLNHFIEPRIISPHFIYAEYHYEKFPDELSQARKICRHIVKQFKYNHILKKYTKNNKLKEIKEK